MYRISDGNVIAVALYASELTEEQFHVAFALALGETESEIADDLELTRDRVHQIRRTAERVMRRAVSSKLGLKVAV